VDTTTAAIERIFREHYGRVVASLAAWSRDLSLAEEAVGDALAVALESWPRNGLPENQVGWITTTARRKAIDRLRRARVLQAKQRELIEREMSIEPDDGLGAADEPTDERLGLIFGCCHPTLSPEAQVTLTLKVLGGLEIDEIARAFLVSEATIAKRVTRAKQKIRDAGIPLEVPSAQRLPERLEAVLLVIYLIFNEGYSAGTRDELVRRELCTEAIRLGGVLGELMPDEPEALGLAALMLLCDSRRRARTTAAGAFVRLEDQDRGLWDAGQIERGTLLLDRAVRHRAPGPYQLQAAVAALHARAARWQDTDWPQIAALYGQLARIHPTPVVRLNRAVAVSMSEGAARGLHELEQAELAGSLDSYQPFHAARADLLRRAGRAGEARAAFLRARELSTDPVERAFLAERHAELAVG
jgi:RNA polymerase sigma-70 factor, ECF subfamily